MLVEQMVGEYFMIIYLFLSENTKEYAASSTFRHYCTNVWIFLCIEEKNEEENTKITPETVEAKIPESEENTTNMEQDLDDSKIVENDLKEEMAKPSEDVPVKEFESYLSVKEEDNENQGGDEPELRPAQTLSEGISISSSQQCTHSHPLLSRYSQENFVHSYPG